jgi:hypothetical protein
VPREHVNNYLEVELGYPSEIDDLIEGYAETSGTNDTVYPYVPIETVEQLILNHGGIKEPIL